MGRLVYDVGHKIFNLLGIIIFVYTRHVLIKCCYILARIGGYAVIGFFGVNLLLFFVIFYLLRRRSMWLWIIIIEQITNLCIHSYCTLYICHASAHAHSPARVRACASSYIVDGSWRRAYTK